VSGEYIFGDSQVFRSLLQQIDLVAPTNYTVIIHGESGSGKEAIAQEIHKRSKRKSKPFVAIDCGALSKELAGSELFGHEKGSFREDLYHRFNEFSIDIPPLRQRPDDVLLFDNHFLQQTNKELGKNVRRLSAEVEQIFKNYVWYGNLRELKNVIKRATLLTD